MFLTEFDAKKQREMDRRDAKEEGREEGIREEGLRRDKIQMMELIRIIIKKVKKNQSLDQISDALEKTPEELEMVYQAVISAGPEYDEEKIYQAVKK